MEEEGGGFAFNTGVGRDDDFGDLVVSDAGEEFLNVELVGSDTIDGGDGATENVVGAFVRFGGFDAVDVERLFYDEDRGLVARGVRLERGDGFVAVDEGEGLGAGFDAGVEGL